MNPATNHTEEQRDVVAKVLSGDFRSLARLITLVENSPSAAVPYLRELFEFAGRAFTVGVTGPPGSGKSTLVDGLTGLYREQGRKVGIIAVDPTSPYTGGAILGDRIRMQSRSVDAGTFIRSMATRGHLGGLARSTNDVLTLLDAAGFDVLLVETVGVGQDEVEVVRTTQTTLVLLVPGMGDDVQAMKAGIMEIGDVFVVNKSDRPGAHRVEVELKALLSLGKRPDGWRPPIVHTVASRGEGIAECAEAIESYRAFIGTSPFQKNRSVQIQKERLLELARSLVLESMLGRPGMAAVLERLAQQVADREIDPYSAVEQLLHS